MIWMERKGKAMRWFYCVLCLTLLGCGESPEGNPSESAEVSKPRRFGGVAATSDWPGFLGPFGTSVSPEKGILTPWPEKGLRVVWQRRAGPGYGMPSISQGRLFLFDR